MPVPKGEAAFNAKATEKMVKAIRRLSEKHTQRELAEMFGISKSQIHRIISGQSWKHVK